MRTQDTKILLDMDGVIANFIAGTCRLHSVRNPYDDPKNYGQIDIQDLIGIAGPAFWARMDREFWAGLPKMPDADTIVDLLEDQFGVKNICILTSPVRTIGCADGKLDWLRKHFPQYRRQFLIGPAKEFCAHKNSILIDDSEANVRKFRDAGGRALLIPALWNYAYALDPLATLISYLEERV